MTKSEIMWVNFEPQQGSHAEPLYAVFEDDWVSDGLEHLREEEGWYRCRVIREPVPVPKQEPEGESVRCSCEWAHPVDGSVRLDCPAELDPACLVHSVQQDPKRDPREAVIREIVNLVIEYEMVWYGEGMPPVWLARLDAADPLRKLLPEVVEVLEEARSPGSRSSHVNAIVRMARRWEKRRDNLLTRLKTFTESE